MELWKCKSENKDNKESKLWKNKSKDEDDEEMKYWKGKEKSWQRFGIMEKLKSEMEKRADTADISVLFFSGCANFLAVYAQTNWNTVLLPQC